MIIPSCLTAFITIAGITFNPCYIVKMESSYAGFGCNILMVDRYIEIDEKCSVIIEKIQNKIKDEK